MPRQPELIVDTVLSLPLLLSRRGFHAVAIVSGGRSVRGRREWPLLVDTMLKENLRLIDFTLRGEPSPQTVDHFYRELRAELPDCDAVVGIGGGSVLDCAKALAAMAGMGRTEEVGSIKDFLEGVGTRQATGETLPLFAVPTTAGTGSEATKNAVLSEIGPGGYKRSIRHNAFIPRLALLDPALGISCPPEVTRASGLDAITQLIEVYLSVDANPLSDTLALEGLRQAGRSFPALIAGGDGAEHRLSMSLAAYVSGVGLASAGLGLVHGIASALGAAHSIPHGVICGLLLAPSIKIGVERAADSAISQHDFSVIRQRYAQAAQALGLSGRDHFAGKNTDEEGAEKLIEGIGRWADGLPRLGSFGFESDEISSIAEKSSGKKAPVQYTVKDICAALENSL